MIRKFLITLTLVLPLALTGCYSATNDVLEANAHSQVHLRSMQSRAFDTTNQNAMLRSVISTMQDLDFVIDKADETLGTVTGTKLARNQTLKMTVSIRPKEKTQTLVRTNIQYGLKAVDKPGPYQEFFTSLSKGMYLEAHQV